MEKLDRWLQWHFALLTVLCGYLLGSDDQASGLVTIALLSAISSVVFVDRLRWFFLPSVVAYLLMVCASMYSMWIFFEMGPGRQLSAVAILLIMVQSILLFQQKSRRVYEQMCVFCLLQLIVGAVVNDALNFGLLLLPISALLLSALVLLQTWRPMDRIRQGRWLKVRERPQQTHWPDIRRCLRRSLVPGWIGMFLLAAAFFYALPRAIGTQPRRSGNVAIGFNEEISLEQFGKLAMNPEVVMRLRFTDRTTGTHYAVQDGAYLRGVVVDEYSMDDRGVGRWKKGSYYRKADGFRRPDVPAPTIVNSGTGYDLVDVHVDPEFVVTTQAFAIAPYFKNAESQSLFHVPGRWQLERAVTLENYQSGKPGYGFATTAFFHGVQTPWLRNLSDDRRRITELDPQELERLLQFRGNLPSIQSEATRIVESLPETRRSKSVICEAFTDYLASVGPFSYTRTLTQPPPEGIDPTEDFFSRTREGHCQYFASALALMLRSQGIPSRIVIGFRVHEFNNLGKFWVVRQQDAHAWVEAYFSTNEIPASARLAGQARNGGAWLRLDPTPPISTSEGGQVGQAMDLAQSLWKEFVVEMDEQRQAESLFSFTGSNQFQSLSLRDKWSFTVARIRAGDLSWSDFRIEQLLSWQAAVISMILSLIGYGTWQIVQSLLSGIHFRRQQKRGLSQLRVPYYYEALVKLLQPGTKRLPFQTPRVWALLASAALRSRDVPVLDAPVEKIIKRYYRTVYGGQADITPDEEAELQEALTMIRRAWEVSRTSS